MIAGTLRLLLSGTLALPPAAGVALPGPPAVHVVIQPAGTPTTPAELDQLYTHAQMQVEGYNATGDVTKVRVAREELSRWLAGHAQVYGYGDAAIQARAPIQQQIAMLDDVLAKSGTPGAVAPAAAPTTVAGTPWTPEQKARQRLYGQLSSWGIVSLSVGAGTLLLGALPAYLLRNNALRYAADESFYVEEQRYISRARRRQTAAFALLGIGSALVGLGITLVAIGATGRARLRREVTVAPVAGFRFAGASATLRF